VPAPASKVQALAAGPPSGSGLRSAGWLLAGRRCKASARRPADVHKAGQARQCL